MKSTLHGDLSLQLSTPAELPISRGGRVDICTVRGKALGQYVNVAVTLDVHTGEVLLMGPGTFVGAFRMGDLVAAHLVQQINREQAQRAVEDGHAAQAH